MAKPQTTGTVIPLPSDTADLAWHRLRTEAEASAAANPEIATLVLRTIGRASSAPGPPQSLANTAPGASAARHQPPLSRRTA